MSTALLSIEREQERLHRRLDELEQEKIDVLRTQDWQCQAKNCGRRSILSSVILVQTYWYTPPHGCTGGDYWNAGERNLICPKCSTRHRMIAQEARPDNYYDLSYAKQQEIDDARKIVMERTYGIAEWGARNQIFDNAIDDYKGRYYAVRKDGNKLVRSGERQNPLSATDIAALYRFSPQAFSSFVNV
jgi:hypothetical protein